MDNRTRYTKKMIWDSFLEILKDTPIQKVTVKEICEKAQINRSTFYRYYTDPYDLMDQIVEELWSSFRTHISALAPVSTYAALEAMFQAIKKERLPYTVLLSQNTGISYYSRMVEHSYGMFQESFKARYPALSEGQRRQIYDYITQGCLAVTTDWIRGGMKESPAQMARFVGQLDDRILEGTFTPL